jgi:hypothetical protein
MDIEVLVVDPPKTQTVSIDDVFDDDDDDDASAASAATPAAAAPAAKETAEPEDDSPAPIDEGDLDDVLGELDG